MEKKKSNTDKKKKEIVDETGNDKRNIIINTDCKNEKMQDNKSETVTEKQKKTDRETERCISFHLFLQGVRRGG